MASRYPLVINNSSTLVAELPNGDSLNLSGSGIFDGTNTGSQGEVLKSTVSGIEWDRAADVYLDDVQTLKNKTLSSCILNGQLNTVTNISNASLISSSIEINGVDIPLGGSVTTPDNNDNTLYTLSTVDGTTPQQKRIRLTASGSGSGTQDLFLNAGYNLTITRTGSDTLEFAAGLTQLRANSDGDYIEGQVTLQESGGTRVSQSGQTITIDSDAFPIGGIIMWYGSVATIPNKWALCNGQTVNGVVTPDLRNRFVLGAGDTYGVNDTGGSKDAVVIQHNHTGTTGTESQSHTHTGTTGTESQSHTHTGTTGTESQGHTHSGTTGTQSANHTHSGNTNNTGNHSHGGSTDSRTANHSHPVNVGGASNNHTHNYADRAYNFGGTERGGGNVTVLKNASGFDIGRGTSGFTASHSHSGSANTSGGSHSHNIGTNTDGGHSHTVNIGNNSGNHTHDFTTGGISTTHTHNMTTGNASQTHTHNITTGNTSVTHTHDITVSAEGAVGTNKNMPPYYALAYIMKVE